MAVEENSLSFGSFDDPKYNMEPNSFWIVKAWDVAATEAGSSGSPLLDREKKVIGTLTGGSSMCGSPKGPDIYASLHKFWEVDSSLNNPNRLSYYLDPEGLGVTQLNGYNPYTDDPYTRSQNFGTDETAIASYFRRYPCSPPTTPTVTLSLPRSSRQGKPIPSGPIYCFPGYQRFQKPGHSIRVYTGKWTGAPPYELPFNCSYQYYSPLRLSFDRTEHGP